MSENGAVGRSIHEKVEWGNTEVGSRGAHFYSEGPLGLSMLTSMKTLRESLRQFSKVIWLIFFMLLRKMAFHGASSVSHWGAGSELTTGDPGGAGCPLHRKATCPLRPLPESNPPSPGPPEALPAFPPSFPSLLPDVSQATGFTPAWTFPTWPGWPRQEALPAIIHGCSEGRWILRHHLAWPALGDHLGTATSKITLQTVSYVVLLPQCLPTASALFTLSHLFLLFKKQKNKTKPHNYDVERIPILQTHTVS